MSKTIKNFRTKSFSRPLLQATALTISILLAGCGWMGKKEEPPLPGKRIDIKTQVSALVPSKNLTSIPVVLPKVYTNKNWEQVGGNSAHLMQHIRLSQDPKELWTADIGDGGSEEQPVLSQPIVANNIVYTMDADYTVRAFDLQTGDRKWSIDLKIPDEDDDAFGGGLAYYNGTLYITTGYAHILALNPKDGKILWDALAPAPLRAAPVIANNILFATSIDNEILAYDSKSGKQVWRHSGLTTAIGLIGIASPAYDVASGTVLAPLLSGEIYAFDGANGRLLWSDNLQKALVLDPVSKIAQISALPIVDRGVVYVVSNSGRFVAFDIMSGQHIWEKEFSSKQTPWIAGDFIFSISTNGYIVALSRQTGDVKWATTLPKWRDEKKHTDPIYWTGPVLANDRLLIANNLGDVWSLSPYTGKPLGHIKLDDGVRLSPVIANGVLLFLDEDGTLTAFR